MFNKLFKPKAPTQFRPEEGVTYKVVFPQDFTKPQPTPAIPLIDQLRNEVKSLTEKISAIPDTSPLDAVNIEHLRDKVRASQKRVESAQAQCRAALAEIETIKPLQDDTDALRRTLQAALARKQERETRAELVAQLRDLQAAAQ